MWLFIALILFVGSSLGLRYVGFASYWLTGFFTGCLFYAKLVNHNGVSFERRKFVLGLVACFFISLSVSTFLSENIFLSLRFLVFYLICLGTAFIGNLYREQIIGKIPIFLIVSGILLCVYSLFLTVFKPVFLLPNDGYQLVFSRFGSHNHLGDFLVLPMIACFYLFMKEGRKKYIGLFLFFLPFFLFAYSRSAYLSLLIPGIVMLINLLRKSKQKVRLIIPSIMFLLVVSLILLFFVATVFESENVTFLKPVHGVLVDNFGLKFKHFGANRLEFFNTAIQSIKEKPYFGVGSGNFVNASGRYSSLPNYRTYSSHNIFLDIFVENGVFAFLFFGLLVVLIIKTAIKYFSIYSLFFLALLINFQTDYSFRIFPIAILFFVFIGIIIGENEGKSKAF